MKKIKEEKAQKILDFILFLIAFYGLLNVVDVLTHSESAGFFIIYPALFSFFLIDAYFFKKLTSVVFWKIIFIIGIVMLIAEDIHFISIFKEIIPVFMFINMIILLFIYRSYQFIISNGERTEYLK